MEQGCPSVSVLGCVRYSFWRRTVSKAALCIALHRHAWRTWPFRVPWHRLFCALFGLRTYDCTQHRSDYAEKGARFWRRTDRWWRWYSKISGVCTWGVVLVGFKWPYRVAQQTQSMWGVLGGITRDCTSFLKTRHFKSATHKPHQATGPFSLSVWVTFS